MKINRCAGLVRAFGVTLGGGTVLATSCSNEEIQAAVIAGLQAATDELAQSQEDDVSFLDWVNSELDD